MSISDVSLNCLVNDMPQDYEEHKYVLILELAQRDLANDIRHGVSFGRQITPHTTHLIGG